MWRGVTRNRGKWSLWIGGLVGIVLWGCEPGSPKDESVPLESAAEDYEAGNESRNEAGNGESPQADAQAGDVGEADATIPCATAVLEVTQGEVVTAGTTLQLMGDASFSPVGAINKWEWSVEQPEGSETLFEPSANVANPTFDVGLPGEYAFSLRVFDEMGNAACEPATVTVLVVPEGSIEVELVWDTPADPDPTDSTGADLDLHVAHPSVLGVTWMETVNPNPGLMSRLIASGTTLHPNGEVWIEVEDDPVLHTDVDGAALENLILKTPEDGATYRIGVHFYEDNGFGPSTATIRVFVGGELQFEQSLELVKWDLWEVATLEWPSGEVTPIGDGEKVIPEYINPFPFNP